MIDWNTKNVLVTGGAGFLGSFVTKLLRRKNVKKLIIPRSKDCDLTDVSNCKRIVKGVDIVFHLAAKVGGIGLNLERPAELFYDNLIMGVQLMNEAKLAGVQKFIALGTICSYPKFATVPFSENSIWDGYPEETNAPYGLAKKMLLVQSQAYRKQYGFKSIVVFPTNLYGPGDNFDPSSSHVIPALIMKVYKAKELKKNLITVWGDGSPTRDFLYVQDAASGVVKAAERFDGQDPLNLGSEEEISIKELVLKIVNLMDFAGKIIWDTSKPNGQPRRCVSNQRASALIGFKPKIGMEEGLKRTISWFENNMSRNADRLYWK
ncbi:MAG: NAD-dependent epimerase/dehydratase family protein [Nitrososphaeraceae archaeon]|nr:NAD-dependent epimerase/dehydratase family protein [Nitrososphaeraceae archaeon]